MKSKVKLRFVVSFNNAIKKFLKANVKILYLKPEMSTFAVCFHLSCKVSESSNLISHGAMKADRKFMSLVLCNPNIIAKLRLLISFQCIQGFNTPPTGKLNEKIT